jgi:molybdate transport system regulatory protein
MNIPGTPTIRLHLWLETDDGLFFGYGRAHLLEKIEKYGSLKKAAESMGMSYRAAWGKIKASEAVLGEQLIVQSGSKKEGCSLTPYGKALKDQFMRWFEEVENAAVRKAAEIFTLPVKRYEKSEK